MTIGDTKVPVGSVRFCRPARLATERSCLLLEQRGCQLATTLARSRSQCKPGIAVACRCRHVEASWIDCARQAPRIRYPRLPGDLRVAQPPDLGVGGWWWVVGRAGCDDCAAHPPLTTNHAPRTNQPSTGTLPALFPSMEAFFFTGVIAVSVILALAGACGILLLVMRLMRTAAAHSMHRTVADVGRRAALAIADAGSGAGRRPHGAGHVA